MLKMIFAFVFVLVAVVGVVALSGCSRSANYNGNNGQDPQVHIFYKPQIISGSLVFNGKSQNPEFCEQFDLVGPYVTVSGVQSAINVGTFTINITLAKPEYYAWQNYSGAMISFSWAIVPAPIDSSVVLRVVDGVFEHDQSTANRAPQIFFGEGWGREHFIISFSLTNGANWLMSIALIAPNNGGGAHTNLADGRTFDKHPVLVRLECALGRNFLTPKIVQTYVIIFERP